jgi:predicted transcriptional regulator
VKTVSLKTDDSLFERLESLSKELHVSKSELIRRAVAEYERQIERRKLKKRFHEASLRIRRADDPTIREWEATLMDGLKDD